MTELLDPKDATRKQGQRLLTERCLIAADVDRTLLEQTSQEKDSFRLKLAPELVQSAALGMQVAFLSGNSMKEVTQRILKLLVGELLYTNHLDLIDRFHFFSNSGGVYSHFPVEDEALKVLADADADILSVDDVLRLLTEETDGEIVIKPKFIKTEYVDRCVIGDDEIGEIVSVLEAAATDYIRDINDNKQKYAQIYDIASPFEHAPGVDMRWITYREDRNKKVSVQMTLKPLLSFRHAKKDHTRKLFGKDLRTKWLVWIQKELDKRGLSHYVARPGGRSSIDVTREKLDKAYALSYLIDHLNVQGNARKGEATGSNTIYLGDEVIVGGGNDYTVTRIPGLLVLAVNPDKELVPFSSNIFVPHDLLEGPDATHDVLSRINRMADSHLKRFANRRGKSQQRIKNLPNAIEAFKLDMFNKRIVSKLQNLKVNSANELQTIHAIVTLMCRDDPDARKWIGILVNELNEIMAELSSKTKLVQAALGTSYDERGV